MKHRFGMGLLGLALMSMLAFAAVACSNSGNEPTKAIVASVGGAAGLTSTISDLPQITLGDGPAGVVWSRFTDPDVEINPTADIAQWEVLDGEFVEVWGYNGQYPGPEIRVLEGDLEGGKVRINLTNDLPESTIIHWHGLEVLNDQDGVPGITQPDIPPDES
jgi:FtsP/CotA-like multicopper oxidase with cupredoxin domain